MAERGLRFTLKFRDNALGQHLPEFHAPLIEWVDLPDGPLGEHAVLVKGDQLAENSWSEPIGEDGVGRAIALEDPVGYEPVRRAFGLDLLSPLSQRQGFALSEDVCQKHVVMSAKVIQRLGKRDKVTRDQPRSLMDQLVEGMLAVSSRLTPVDGASRVGHLSPIERDVFAVALHRQLLQISWKSLQVLLVRQHGHCLGTEEVVVPD